MIMQCQHYSVPTLNSIIDSALLCQVGVKLADQDMEKEQARRMEELTEEEYQRRVAITHKMIDVQKQLLATHKPVQVRRWASGRWALEVEGGRGWTSDNAGVW